LENPQTVEFLATDAGLTAVAVVLFLRQLEKTAVAVAQASRSPETGGPGQKK
jgi:hypothetical protein